MSDNLASTLAQECYQSAKMDQAAAWFLRLSPVQKVIKVAEHYMAMTAMMSDLRRLSKLFSATPIDQRSEERADDVTKAIEFGMATASKSFKETFGMHAPWDGKIVTGGTWDEHNRGMFKQHSLLEEFATKIRDTIIACEGDVEGDRQEPLMRLNELDNILRTNGY